MEWHLFLGVFLLVAAVLTFYKARRGREFSRRDAWTAAMMAGLGLTEILPLLQAMLPTKVDLTLIGFAYGVAVTSGVAAAVEKSPSYLCTGGKSLQEHEG